MRFAVQIFLLVFFFFCVIKTSVFANDATITPAQTMEKNSSQSAIVQYNLAFPGILPDNPLYKLKVLRDKLTLGLINDPLKKIEFYLLSTDKGILATAILVDKKNISLAKETALKAENNYTLLTHELYNLPKKPGNDFFKKLQTASLKHQQVLSSLAKRVSKDDKKTFDQVIDFSKRNWSSVEEYRSKKHIIKL